MQLKAKTFFGAVAGVVFCFSTSATIFANPYGLTIVSGTNLNALGFIAGNNAYASTYYGNTAPHVVGFQYPGTGYAYYSGSPCTSTVISVSATLLTVKFVAPADPNSGFPGLTNTATFQNAYSDTNWFPYQASTNSSTNTSTFTINTTVINCSGEPGYSTYGPQSITMVAGTGPSASAVYYLSPVSAPASNGPGTTLCTRVITWSPSAVGTYAITTATDLGTSYGSFTIPAYNPGTNVTLNFTAAIFPDLGNSSSTNTNVNSSNPALLSATFTQSNQQAGTNSYALFVNQAQVYSNSVAGGWQFVATSLLSGSQIQLYCNGTLRYNGTVASSPINFSFSLPSATTPGSLGNTTENTNGTITFGGTGGSNVKITSSTTSTNGTNYTSLFTNSTASTATNSSTFQETTNSNILQTSTGAQQYSSTPSSNVAGAAIIQTPLGPQEISNATNPLNSQSAALFNSQLIAALNSNNSLLSSNLTSGFSGLSNAMSANSGSGTNTNSGGTNDVPYLASLSNSVSTATNSSSTNPPLPNTNSLPNSPSLYSSSSVTSSSTSLLQVTIPSIAGGLSSLSATQVIDLDPMHNSMLAPIIRGVFNIIILIITGIFLAYVFDQVFESLKGFTQISTTQGISGGVFGGAVSIPSGLIFAGIITTVLVALPTLFSAFTSWQSAPTPSSFSAYGSAISSSSAAGGVAWYLFTNFIPFDFAVTTACNAILFRVFRNSVFSAAAAIKIFIVGA